ncbi:MAG TPA: hypothetical protein VIH11_01820 [Gemmatimonadaceae bacterium]|nr:hypothetical protein [Gemmatimonadaceae bacterium]
MAMNTGKVVVGGLVAGLVMNVIDYVTNTYVLATQMKTEMDKLNPSLMTNMEGSNTMITWIVLDFVLGILLVWTYAAIRPRFGAGPKTAVYAGLLFWLIGGVLWASLTAMGMWSWSFFALAACGYLVNMLVSSVAGAAVYTET